MFHWQNAYIYLSYSVQIVVYLYMLIDFPSLYHSFNTDMSKDHKCEMIIKIIQNISNQQSFVLFLPDI